MFISDLRIENFKGFYGVHDFHFLKGLNVILGPCGEGKTSLCHAIEYGLFGGVWGPPERSSIGSQLSDLVNTRHREEHQEKYEFYDTLVALEIVIGGKTFRIRRNVSFHGDGEASEKLRYSTDIKLGLTRSVFQDLIYIDEGISEDHRLDFDSSLSAGERMSEYLENQVVQNIRNDIRMIVLDSALDRLAQERKRECLRNLVDQDLEQIILLESPADNTKGLEEAESKKYVLGATLEKVDISVEDFPFQLSVLENELKWNMDGVYMVNGDVFEKQVFNEKYSVVFSDIIPNGGRFSQDETQLIFETR